MIAVVTHSVSGSVRTCSWAKHMARRGSSRKILGGPGPLASSCHHKHYVGDKNEKPSKIWDPATIWGPGLPWPQRRTAPAYGHRIARIWTPLIMPSGVPFSRWSTIVKVSSQLTNWNERLSRHGRNYRNRSSSRVVSEMTVSSGTLNSTIPYHTIIVKSVGEWHRRLEWLRSATTGGHIELMFSWHAKCWFCVPVLFVGVFCSVIWCSLIKEQTIAIHHLLRLLTFARWRHFIFQSWFK